MFSIEYHTVNLTTQLSLTPAPKQRFIRWYDNSQSEMSLQNFRCTTSAWSKMSLQKWYKPPLVPLLHASNVLLWMVYQTCTTSAGNTTNSYDLLDVPLLLSTLQISFSYSITFLAIELLMTFNYIFVVRNTYISKAA